MDFSSSPLFSVYFESEFTFFLVLFVTEVVDFLLLAVTPDFPPTPCADDSGPPLTILAFDPKTRLVIVFLDPDFQFELDGLAGLIIYGMKYFFFSRVGFPLSFSTISLN